MIIKVSYDLTLNTPLFGENPPNRLEEVDSLKKGSRCNSFTISLFNHNGTHIDTPNHFDINGKKICDYQLEDFIFERPCLIDIPKKHGEQITLEDFRNITGQIKNCDILLIRTGFGEKRGESIYFSDNPWISPDAAQFIRRRFIKLKAIGIDTISISSFKHIEAGETTHLILLKKGDYTSEPLLIIEDINLGVLTSNLKKLFAIPLFVDGVDSMPCTVFVEM